MLSRGGRHVTRVAGILWITLVAMVTAQGANKVARIVSPSQSIGTMIGHTISLNCEVENTENRAVQWWFVEHNVQISSDSDILTHVDPEDHFTIIKPEGGTYPHWNLQIKTIRSSDSGHYRCQIEGTDAAIISDVYIENDPNAVQRPQVVPPTDFTECCVAEGVSEACMPVCNPYGSNITVNFDPRNCINDLLKLLKCGADGRNHAPCCRRQGLPIPCLDFCVNNPPSVLTDDLSVCLNNAPQIIACFQEGQHLLPSTPQRVRVTPQTSHSLYVKWEKPSEGNFTGYRVFYTPTTKSAYLSTKVIAEEEVTLDDLAAITAYNVYVVAVNVYGSSLPSYTVQATTLGSIPLVPSPSDEDFQECCERRGVSDPCQGFLCRGSRMSGSSSGVLKCLPEMEKVFTCMAAERNHTDCCVMRNVPSHCHPLCAGTLQQADYSNIDCFTKHMADITSCFEEGRGTLPGPPTNLVLTSVTDDTAVLSWEPPTSQPEKVLHYLVTYKMMGGNTVQFTTRMTRTTLDGLQPGTQYEVKVAAGNDQGSSLPAPEIIFLTYYSNGDVAPSMAPAVTNQSPPPTLDECCTAEAVQPKCRPLCNYNVSFSDFEVDLLLECERDIAKVLMCGAGGSNHTQCCQRRGIADQCLSFCAFDRETMNTFVFDYAHIGCVYLSPAISQCMSEGIETHPTWPEQLQVQNYTSHTISLTWEQPRRVGTDVASNKYVVRYRKVKVENLWHEILVPGSARGYIIQNLDTDQMYDVQVLAAAGDKRSLPGETFEITTRSVGTSVPALLPNLNFTAPGNITECCIEEGVNSECLSLCDGYSIVKIEEEVCATDLDKLLRCSADNRDHRPCCQQRNVPEQCLGFCVGDGQIEHFVSMLCLSFSQVILTCFHQGYGKLPSSPVDFRVQQIGATYLVTTWEHSEKGGDPASNDLWYDLYYRAMGQDSYTPMHHVTPPHNLTGLKPFTTYQVFLVAENTNGSSRPSPTIDVWTLEEKLPALHVWQVPDGNLQENTGVTISCVSDGDENTYIYWITPRGTEVHDPIIDFSSVNRTHTGRYTCIADGRGGKRVSKDLYLHVMFGPEATAVESEVSVEPSRGLTARLRCQFKGFPDHVTWLYQGVEISPAYPGFNRFKRSLTTNEEMGIILAMLEIQNVQLQDYGTYSCRGSNKMGVHRAQIHLISKYTHPNPTPAQPTFRPAPKQANVTACCIQKGVQPMCMPACSFDVDLSILRTLPNEYLCLGDLTHLVQCGADGKNHTKCCDSRQVPARCHSFCAGVVPEPLDDAHLECLEYIEKIVLCMEEGAEYIPSAPRHVKAELTTEGYIRVWWEPPAVNEDKVQQYYIFYTGPADGQKRQEIPPGETQVVLSGIHSNTQYEIFIEAHNHHGSSHNSNHVFITTTQFTPSEPRNLQGHLLAGVNVRLDWEAPQRHPGAVTHYIIYYRPENAKRWKMVTTKFVSPPRFDLEDLMPNVDYQIKVKANSSTHLSRESNVIVIKTEEWRPMPARATQGDNNVGVALGVAFAVIILLIIAISIAFWYFKVRRNTGNGYKESVSFENPGYATASEARVSGLPSYAAKRDSAREAAAAAHTAHHPDDIKDPAIMRETDAHSDQGYSTLSPSTDLTPASTPSSHTATLDVTQLNPLEANQIDLEEVAAKL